jgi:pimeloyl-ACP methyl ester carboxylesterase
MAAPTDSAASLAYDDAGAGTPVVFLHGLTFDRRSWRPIIERLHGSVESIAIDLPAHGESGGAPAPLDEVAAQVHDLVSSLAVDRPVIVGHSMSGGVAAFYAAAYPSRGVVTIDNGPDIRPIAQLAQRLEPVLRGPGFTAAWRTFEDSLGLERVPESVRSLVLETHEVNQAVVVGYWETLLRTDPDELQAFIDTHLRQLDVPCLAVFGRPITDSERERFGWLQDVQLEEWVGDGHFVHLVDPDRFAARLIQFIDHCTAAGAERPMARN